MKDLLANYLSLIPNDLLPFVSVGMVAFSVLLVLLLFILCIVYINSRPAPVVIRKNDKKVDAPKEETQPKIRHEDIPIISGRLGELLTLNGLLKAGPITKIFFKVLEIVNSSTYDVRWRYKLPFFMMVGPENSGKTTLLNSLNFEHLTEDGSFMYSMWKLFKKAAIFELPRIDVTENEGKFWAFISELFVFIRPRRPLDGLIVTLPADMLISDTTNIEKHSREMFEKIFEFQRSINFRLPIYIIVTKTDVIDGFSEFASLLSIRTKQQLFGWSCPHSIGTAFSTAWVSEIFKTIESGIRKAVLHFSKDKKLSENLEQAILFQSNFDGIKGALAKYIYAMFQSHNPEDGLLLRGVYFVGRQKETICSGDAVKISSLHPSFFSNMDTSIANSYNDDLYFAHDLFSEKIFKEYNIAHPIKFNAIDMNKTEYRNKLAFAIGSVVLSIGWFFGNHNIRNKIVEYYQSFMVSRSTMMKIKYLEDNLSGPDDQATINKLTANLLQNLPTAKKMDLLSIFVPQSWFSSLKSEVKETIGLIFDSVVLRAMYIDLNLNTKNLLQNTAGDSYDDHDKKDIFDIGSFPSFKNFKEFVSRILTLERVSSEYNSIRQLEDRKSILDLTNSLFKDKFDIADEMKSHAPNKKLTPPIFDVSKFQKSIEANLETTFTAFLNDVFDKTIERILQNVTDDIQRLSLISKEPQEQFTTKDLAKLYGKTVLVADIFKNKNLSWISRSHFSPTKEYINVMNDINTSDIISKKCVRKLIKESEIEFNKFKEKLGTYKTEFTEKLLTENSYVPSSGFLIFQKEIKSMLDMPFICVVPENDFNTVILDDKMLIWDVRRLKELSDLIDKFREFSSSIPKDMRPQYFDVYKAVARKCFFPTVKSMLASSQIFDDMPLGNSRSLLEEAYRRQASNIKNVSAAIPKIVKLLDEMEEENNLRDFGFSTLVISNYLSLLEKIDALLSLETPYSSGRALFNDWNGDGDPKYLNIPEHDYLKKYLTSQFERIRFLAKDLASPIVDLLSMPHIAEKIPDRSSIEKWKEIIAGVNDYELKKPGNSLAALESFIADTLSKVSIDSFDAQGEIKEISRKGGDYFLEKRSEVAKALLSRADIVQYDKASSAYSKISRFYRENLENKFPFGNSESDASVTDIEEFVKIYEKSSANLISIFEKHKENKKINKKAIDFLEYMDKLLPFLKAWISHSKSSSAKDAVIAFNVEMRPTPDAEALTASVLGRTVFVGETPVKDKDNAVYFNGDSVKISFGWVKSSSEKPNKQGASPEMSIDGANVIFAYSGKWAMLRLLEKNKTNKEIEYPNGIPVQFSIPMVDSGKGNSIQTTKLVMKFTPMMKTGDKLAPIAWPVFPSSCPKLHITEEANEITNGQKKMDVDVSFDTSAPK